MQGERERVVATIREQADLLRRRGIARLRLFGSVARDEATDASDVDLIADLDPRADFSLLDHAIVEDELSELVGRRVEMTTAPGKLRPSVRARAQRDAVEIF
jgi:uncharacterized protein